MEEVKSVFEFIWKIKHFAYCTQQREEFLKSPLFTIDQIDWCLVLFPRGDFDRKYLSCYLQRSSNCRGLEEVGAYFTISIIKSDNSEVEHDQKLTASFKKGDKHGYVRIQKRKDLFMAKSIFLLNDTLTIRCQVWKDCAESLVLNSPRAYEMAKELFYGYRNNASVNCNFGDLRHTAIGNGLIELKRRVCPFPSKCVAQTRIRVEHRTFSWEIHRFSSLTQGTVLSIPNFPASPHSPVFQFSAYLTGDSIEQEKLEIEVRIIEQSRNSKIAMTCKVSLVDKDIDDIESVQNQHLFFLGKESAAWKFPVITKNQVMDCKNKYLKNDTLTLRLQLVVSDGLSTSHIEETHVIPVFDQCQPRCLHCPSSLKEDFTNLYLKQINCDVSLSAENEVFRAHRFILRMRSPVFKDILENTESDDIIELQGIKPKTVNKLLLYMYSDALTDVQVDSVLELYSAAVKFQLHSLEDKCSYFLKCNISVDNVCKVLALANHHQNSVLATLAEEYICRNIKHLMQTSAWKELLEHSQYLRKSSDVSRKRKRSGSITETEAESIHSEDTTPA